MANLSSRSSPSAAALERSQQQPADALPSESGRPQSLSIGSGSPSPFDPRYIAKRARELQVQDMSFWPQLAANSPLVSPKRERESAFDNPSPASASIRSADLAGGIGLGSDLVGDTSSSSSPSTFSPAFRQRARAGTLPSRLSSSSLTGGQLLNPLGSGLLSQSVLSTAAPSPSPYSTRQDQLDRHISSSVVLSSSSPNVTHQSSAQSRYRSGSLNLPTHRPMYGAFGSSVFSSTSWNDASENVPSDHELPALSTLDYLGLEDTPHPPFNVIHRQSQEHLEQTSRRLAVSKGPSPSSASTNPSFLTDMSRLRTDVNRLRSYSVNATERYDENQSGAALEGLVEEIDEHHDLDQLGQLGGLHAVSSRPRSRTTAGPDLQSRIKAFVQMPSRLDYTQNINHSTGVSNGDIVTADESSIINSLDDKSVGPTRALWLGNIPPTATVASLTSMFSQYGTVESARILSNKSSGFINYTNIDAAIQAKAALNGTEIVPGTGSLKIGFAKLVQQSTPSASNVLESGSSNESTGISYTVKDTTKLEKVISIPNRTLRDMEFDMIEIVREYGADEEELSRITSHLSNAISFTSFVEDLPTLPDPNPHRVYDAPKLRDIRKRIDSGSCSVSEIEAAANDMLDEIVELASDYLGNTVVQKLFDNCSEDMKTKILQRLAPYLAQLGIHKNGTWAAQKVIDVTKTKEQMGVIVNSLRPYTVHLFLDQFGNYVLQCCLRFGSPYNDFIFETMLSKFWDIAQGRFGARAMRACLESHYANKEQQRVLAAAITLHAVQLATNANGALLLTWFLDTCTLPNRHRILAPRLIPHLVPLCTHKLASLTVLKVVNYRAEPEARRAIFEALILNPDESALEEILRDSSQGPTVIYKILTTPFLEADIRQRSIAAVRNVIVRLKVHPSQGYRRLMDEVGLSTRSNGSAAASGGVNGAQHHPARQSNRSSNHNHHHHIHNPHHQNGRAYGDGHQREFGQHHAQPIAQVQQLPYYGSSIYEPASLDYISTQPDAAAMDYLTMHMEQLGLTATGATELQYAAAPSQMVNPSTYQQSLVQQQIRTGQSQPPYFYAPNSPPPSTVYAEQFRGLSSPSQTQAVPYTPEQFRGMPLVGGQGVSPQQLQASSPVLNSSHLMYSTYLGRVTPVYTQPPRQQAQNNLRQSVSCKFVETLIKTFSV
ncbi:hypothetical protein V1517DRAFT_61499 [Lipomyces orientalis]|uniref:Uncharacterized protein n=1 Tax=Lipomyces orientalis TaxID=1233043 RepID=A0ACC3TDA5_9ASCO